MPNNLLPKYVKHPISLDEQIFRLHCLGLSIDDPTAARAFLKHTSYYRFKGYMLAFRRMNVHGKPLHSGTRFQDVVDIMEFDRELRNITLSAIDVLEVAIRTIFNEQLAKKYQDAFWYQNSFLFSDRKKYGAFLSKCAFSFTGSKELFAEHYNKTYGKPPLPPGWMLIEVCTLGTWSHLYSNLKISADKTVIADIFGVPKKVFQSWLRALSDLRNTCAHQSRTWNRKFGIKPKIPNSYNPHLISQRQHPFLASTDRYAVMAMMIQHLMAIVRPDYNWKKTLKTLMDTVPQFRHFNMGFSTHWTQDPFWS